MVELEERMAKNKDFVNDQKTTLNGLIHQII